MMHKGGTTVKRDTYAADNTHDIGDTMAEITNAVQNCNGSLRHGHATSGPSAGSPAVIVLCKSL